MQKEGEGRYNKTKAALANEGRAECGHFMPPKKRRSKPKPPSGKTAGGKLQNATMPSTGDRVAGACQGAKEAR